jgi:anti-anti-sigma factor
MVPVTDIGTGRIDVAPAVDLGDATVVHLHGDIDMDVTDPLADCVTAGLERDADVVIDLSDVTLIDCVSLSALVEARRRADRRGLRMSLVAPPPQVRRTLDAAGLDTDLAPRRRP